MAMKEQPYSFIQMAQTMLLLSLLISPTYCLFPGLPLSDSSLKSGLWVIVVLCRVFSCLSSNRLPLLRPVQAKERVHVHPA